MLPDYAICAVRELENLNARQYIYSRTIRFSYSFLSFRFVEWLYVYYAFLGQTIYPIFIVTRGKIYVNICNALEIS